MGEVDMQTALDWRGRTVVDRDGERIGTLREIYLDESERPTWGSVHTAMFGLRETLVPLTEAAPEDDRLRLPYTRDHVKHAPNADPDVQLEPDDEERLYRHYGMGGEEPEPASPGERPGAVATATTDELPADDPEPDSAPESAPAAMTRSEEEIQVGTRTRERGRARLRKYIVTDYVEKKIPVRREEVRVEYEPAEDPESD
jgi:hypothetical protein